MASRRLCRYMETLTTLPGFRLIPQGQNVSSGMSRRCLSSTSKNDSEAIAMMVSMNRLGQSIKDRDQSATEDILNGMPDVNVKNNVGWTPLMLNSQLGNCAVLDILEKRAANPEITCGTGQTAVDIAAYWNNKPVYDRLSGGKPRRQPVPFFTQSPLRRVAEKRNNEQWMNEMLTHESTKFLPTRNSVPLATRGKGRKLNVKSCSYSDISSYIIDDLSNVIFLGLNQSDQAVFSVDFSGVSKDKLDEMFDGAHVINPYPDFLFLSRDDAAICGHAQSLWDWHLRHKFCPTCGSETVMKAAGYKRKCVDKSCSTNKGIFNTSYPRVDPTIICTVLSPDHRMCLLGRKESFPPGMYSCIAGFVEPGEGIEDACVREVAEEVGQDVQEVRYIASQPWPRPSSLMLGCEAIAKDQGEIKLDKEELEDARWFNRKECVQMLTMQHPEKIWTPPSQALANQLIHDWVMKTAFREE